MSQHIVVTEYNPLWVKQYEEESLLIKGVLAENCVAIYHIGSTSVPGLAAKPVIDILAAVRSLEKVDRDAEDFCEKEGTKEPIKSIFSKWMIGAT